MIMNALLTSNSELTMSSREIATLCNKRHDNVMADIRKMLDKLDIYAPDFSGTFITERGNQYECFNLPKRECLILVSGYNVKIRTKIIDRWQELEQGKTKPLPQTKLEALKAYVAEIEAHELTKTHLTHEKELAKKDNGKSIYGASIKQVNQVLNSTYTWQPLKKYCEENNMELEYIFPNGYGSLAVVVYPYDAWLNVYEIDLNLIFKD